MNAVDLSDFSNADRKYLRGFCYRFTKDYEEAEDLMQATLLTAIQRNYKGECSKRTWLCLIARTEFLQDYRRRRARIDLRDAASLEDVKVAMPSGSPLADLVRERGREQVRRAVASLPAKYQAAVNAYWFNERSILESCADLGISRPAMKARLHYAKIMLRKRLTN